MNHLCQNCKFVYFPHGMHDYYVQTFRYPRCPEDWGKDYRKQLFFLCQNENVADVDHTNNTIIMKPCNEYNFNGQCHYYRAENAIDILPSTIELSLDKILEEGPIEPTDPVDPPTDPTDPPTDPTEPEEEPIYVDDKYQLTITVTPYSEPAETEDVQKTDIDGEPMFDDEGNPVMETVEVKPEFINPQEISCKYQWYKNGRKLWKEKEPVLILDTSKPSSDEYSCEVTQSIEDNGDGGDKVFSSMTDTILIEVVEKEEEPEEPTEPDNPDIEEPDDPSSDDQNP